MLWKALSSRLFKLRELFNRVDPADRQTTQDALILADVGVRFAQLLTDHVSKSKTGVAALKDEIVRLIERPRKMSTPVPPEVIMVAGVNGSGKTTTVAKLAHHYAAQGKKVIVVSADTYRDAASEQLEIWARKAGVDIVTSQLGQDGASVAYDAVTRAVAQGYDYVLVDTAGRLHTRSDLLEELKKIKRVIGKLKPGSPEQILLTIDASLGQNSIRQAVAFNAAVGLTGLVLTKMDGTAKGGAIIPIVDALNVPVEFIAVGEAIDDLFPFDAVAFVTALIGSDQEIT